jgi:serine/threonine-protein kinase
MEGRDLLAGRYELRGVLGRGGMAEVHDGWDTRLDRAVAIKLLYPAFAADVHMRRRFEAEARAAAGLSHPNIVAVHDSGEHDGTPFIVMERLPGRTLADLIAAGPMPPQRVRAMLCDVLGALAVAHAAGILHRDVKPGNILVTGDGNTMKVADFGIAKTAGAAHTATGQIVGTMAYMSPQRVAGAPASVADDVYAVGVLGYEALAGRSPFPQENPAALLRAILDRPPPPIMAIRPDTDPMLAAVIDRAMAHETEPRFGSAEQMRAALTGVASAPLMGSASAPRPATKVLAEPLAPSANYYVAPAPRRRPMSRERKLLLAAAAFVVFVVAALALALDPSSSTRPPEPIGTSTPVQPPPPPPPTTTAPPPPSSAVPIVEAPKKPKKGEQGNGRGNGNGNNKRD